jgi:hypothetical protein
MFKVTFNIFLTVAAGLAAGIILTRLRLRPTRYIGRR